MNFGLLCIIFIISETNSLYINDTSFHKDAEENRVLLRKLQNLQEHDSRNASQTPSWSEILADILVKRIFPFHKTNNETERLTAFEDEKNILVSCFSFVLKVYKRYLYDKLNHDRDTSTDIINTKSKVNTSDTNSDSKPNNEIEVAYPEIIDNPNDDVEIIEPKYHGKLCDNCKGDNEIESSACEEGLIRDANGICVSKSSKFILSIPSQCPIGYKRDWLGYCRITL
ncbi:unnamed protein product [Euphydryas editha]|uniref:Uncharacterized protein n=1 Tax=Euphydryas editha TaxID=104508 RepID=A0AAU9TC87_EUPED|nr:unnamed protein product [Euphydryas editha]